jgi:hypothetical protein
VFDNRVLTKVIGRKGEEIPLRGGKENCGMRSIVIFADNQIFGWLMREKERGGACSTHGREENPEETRLLRRLKRRLEDSVKN